MATSRGAAQAAEGRDDDLPGTVAGLSRPSGPSAGFSKRSRPGTASRLLAVLDEAEADPVEGYRDRVTGKMQSMPGIREFLMGIGKSTSPRIARAKP